MREGKGRRGADHFPSCTGLGPGLRAEEKSVKQPHLGSSAPLPDLVTRHRTPLLTDEERRLTFFNIKILLQDRPTNCHRITASFISCRRKRNCHHTVHPLYMQAKSRSHFLSLSPPLPHSPCHSISTKAQTSQTSPLEELSSDA